MQESETALEKARAKFESANDEIARCVNPDTPASASTATSHKKMLNFMKRGKTEDEAREKASVLNEQYKSQLNDTNAIRKKYFNVHLPHFVRGLKETNDDCDVGLQRYLEKYARFVESNMMLEASTISPVEPENGNIGLVAAFEKVNIKTDFQDYVNSYLSTRGLLDKSDRQYVGGDEKGARPKKSEQILNATENLESVCPSFGVGLSVLTDREDLEEPVPRIVSNLITYITENGMEQQGIYRISASGAHVTKLRHSLHRGILISTRSYC
jgi:Rho GTPase-activating protein RGD1